MAQSVRRPYERLRLNVVNQSSRNGTRPLLIVVHSTEGQNILHSMRDLEGLGSWFNNPQAQASSNVGVDSDGYSALFVPDERKAWAQAYYNPWSLSIEFVGKAALADETEAMYDKGAMYIAYWSKKYNIPIRKGSVTTGGKITRTGVIRHSDLGHLGGDHHDPGSSFNLAHMNDLARNYLKHGW
jgi:hypothetical protein